MEFCLLISGCTEACAVNFDTDAAAVTVTRNTCRKHAPVTVYLVTVDLPSCWLWTGTKFTKPYNDFERTQNVTYYGLGRCHDI